MHLRRHGAIQLGWQTSNSSPAFGGFSDFTFAIPTLNDATFAAPLLDLVSNSFPGSSILVVDDGSTDGTQESVLKYVGKSELHVNLLERRGNLEHGVTACILDAIDRCGTKHIIVLDPRARQPYEALSQLVRALQEGVDLASIGYTADETSEPWTERMARLMAKSFLRRRGILINDPMANAFGANLERLRPAIGGSLGRFELKGGQFLFDLLKVVDPQTTISEVELNVPVLPSRRMTSTSLGKLSFIRSILR